MSRRIRGLEPPTLPPAPEPKTEAPRSTGAPATAAPGGRAASTPTPPAPSGWTTTPAGPLALSGEARAAHVAAAILDYEAPLPAARPSDVRRKLEKLATSPFVFFRGTADLFFRDLAGLDGDRPQVLAYGDLHPENLGVRRTPEGVLFYGFDDFDETHPAPFSWDLRRGATALELAGREAGWAPAERAAVSEAFLSGYAATLAEIRDHGPSEGPRLTQAHAAGAASALLAAADDKTRKQLVKQHTEDGAFEASDRLQPVGKKTRKALAKALNAYRKTLSAAPRDADFHALKDAASRLGSGTGSVGLERLWVLIEGKTGKDKDDVILELKERRPSVLARHVPAPVHRLAAREARTEASVQGLWAAGDRFAGTVTYDGRSFAVRERLPQHDRLSFDALAPADAEAHAREIGALLADLHTGQPLSGPRTPAAARKLAGALLDSIAASPLDALSAWARDAADRVETDQAAFAARLAAGAVLPPA